MQSNKEIFKKINKFSIKFSIFLMFMIWLENLGNTKPATPGFYRIILVLIVLYFGGFIIGSLYYMQSLIYEKTWAKKGGIICGIVISLFLIFLPYIDPIPKQLLGKKLEYQAIEISSKKIVFEIGIKKFTLCNYANQSVKSLYKKLPKTSVGTFWFKKRFPRIIGFKIKAQQNIIYANPNLYVKRHKIFQYFFIGFGIFFILITLNEFRKLLKG